MRSAYMGALRIERRTFRKTVSKIFRDFSLLLSQLSYAPFIIYGELFIEAVLVEGFETQL